METLKAIARTNMGTRRARDLRREGMVPGIIYGHKEPPVAFAVSEHDLGRLLQHGEHLVELDLDGQKGNYLVKDVQYDPLGVQVVHVDFARVNLDEAVEVTVPVTLRGTPAGAADGGVLMPALAVVKVRCLVTSIPEEIRVSVKDLKVGDVLHVRDLPALEGVTILLDGDAIVASCQRVAEEVAAPVVEGEEPAQPEVIGKGKKEEEEGEGQAAAE